MVINLLDTMTDAGKGFLHDLVVDLSSFKEKNKFNAIMFE